MKHKVDIGFNSFVEFITQGMIIGIAPPAMEQHSSADKVLTNTPSRQYWDILPVPM